MGQEITKIKVDEMRRKDCATGEMNLERAESIGL